MHHSKGAIPNGIAYERKEGARDGNAVRNENCQPTGNWGGGERDALGRGASSESANSARSSDASCAVGEKTTVTCRSSSTLKFPEANMQHGDASDVSQPGAFSGLLGQQSSGGRNPALSTRQRDVAGNQATARARATSLNSRFTRPENS